ncbi:hypothetical protein ASF60_11590 [Methylobacterium sp. Leaf113]|uniref:beta strand repeat-containing protein n=1 Tax=Methylobacterium sp. Leaf113 TaxID=1736259 RepID=UPI000700B5BD|nr:hypothetical protein [Methylobacterium sp. Leaf113]KQP72786.1 hypothetical protein ASF60_11590 [Methylobacterium sp. Leaf113]
MSSTNVLTAGQDTVLALDGDQTVQAIAATLNAGTYSFNPTTGTATYTGGDQLDGGAGYDVLALTGPGSFDLANLAQFTGFEEVHLTNVTSSSASLTLRDGVDLKVTLSDGTTTPGGSTAFPTAGGFSVTLSTGRVTLQGGSGSDQIYVNGSTKLQAGSVIDGGAGYDTLSLSAPYNYNPTTGASPSVDTTYDLTGISLNHVENLNVSGSIMGAGKTIVKVDAASLADVTSISLGYNGTLATTATALDLTSKIVSSGLYPSVSTGTITSLNTTGTSFTVGSFQTALQIVGGTGQDAMILKGTTLTSAQRDQLFASSIETVTDASGTYTKPPLPAGTTLLTTGADVVLLSAGDQTVQATSATLNVGSSVYSPATGSYTYTGGDQLDGGAGYDVLALTGPGSFDLANLAQFTGFEEVRLTNVTSSYASLTLRDSVDLKVILSDGTTTTPSGSTAFPTAGGFSVTLGTGRVTLQGGNGSDQIFVTGSTKLQAGSVIDGGAGYDTLSLSAPYNYNPATGMSSSVDTTYDLTGISLSHVESLSVSGSIMGTGKTIVKVDAATLADVTSISLGYNGTLATTAAALDLTGKIASSGLYPSPGTGVGTITSLNTTGTSFTVDSYQTALQIVGGTGQDTVILKGTTLTSAQREQLFASSIETITDNQRWTVAGR